MGVDIELSIEETNKLRAQIGLPLIPIPGKEVHDSDPKELNIDQTNILRASLGLPPLKSDNAAEKIQVSPSKRSIRAHESKPITGKNGGTDFFYNQVDDDLWLDKVGEKKSTHREEASAFSVTKEANIEVEHGLKALSTVKDGEVFTLRDQGLLDDANDVLFNDTLAKATKENQDDLEKKRVARLVYGPKVSYDSEEEDTDSSSPIIIKSSTIDLSKTTAEDPKDDRRDAPLLFTNVSTEAAVVPIKMKKLKTKKAKLKRKRNDDIIVSQKMTTSTFVDEEDDDAERLDALFAASRDKKLKQRKLMSAEQIALEVSSHLRMDALDKIEGIVYDNTRDFLDSLPSSMPLDTKGANLLDPQAKDKSEAIEKEPFATSTNGPRAETSPDTSAADEELKEPLAEESGSKNEPSFNNLLDTLKYLRKTNAVRNYDEKQRLAEKQQRENQKQAQYVKLQISIEERMVREELEKDLQYLQLSATEKEAAFDRVLNERLVLKGIIVPLEKRGRYSAYAKTDRLAGYNPQVKVAYKDEKGNILDKKQAWKQLLHRYHGLAPKHKKEIVRAKTESEAREILP